MKYNWKVIINVAWHSLLWLILLYQLPNWLVARWLTVARRQENLVAQTRHERIFNVKLKTTSFAISKRLLSLWHSRLYRIHGHILSFQSLLQFKSFPAGKTAGELTAPPAAFPALWDLCRREEASWAVLAWSLHVLWPVCKDGNSCVAFTAAIKLNLNERPCRLSVLREERKGWPEEIMKCEKLLFANTIIHISKMFIAVKMFLTFSSQPIKF